MKNVCSGGGIRRSVFIKRMEGHFVAGGKQYAALRENQEKYNKESQEIIAYMNEEQNTLLAATERKQ